MNRDRWERIDALCHAALERAPADRAAFLDEACAGDADLRREVESLLALAVGSREAETRQLPLMNAAMTALLAAGSLYLAVLAVTSLGWHMEQDSPILYYTGFLIDQLHLEPYRDFFDMNVPGAYLVNAIAGHVFGFTEAGFRAADLVCLGTLLGLTWRVMRTFGRMVAWCAVVFGGTLYLLSGQSMSFQRECILLVPTLLAVVILLDPRLPRGLRCSVAGACVGVAATIKPQAAIVLPLLAGFEWREVSRATNPQRAGVVVAVLTGGFLVPVLAAVAYLWRHGALAAFVDIARNYWPLYNSLSGTRPNVILSGPDGVMYVAGHYVTVGLHPGLPLVFAGAIGAFVALRRSMLAAEARRRVLLLAALAVAFSVAAAAAGKFWPYHWFPFNYLAMMVASLCLLPLRPAARVPRGLVPFALLLMIVALPWLAEVLRRPGGELTFAEIQQVASHLERRLSPGDTVQPLDWTGGAVHAMLLARAVPSTRFLYDFHFFHHLSDPYIERIRREFLDELRKAPPRFVVAVERRGRLAGPNTARTFAALDAFLADRYERSVVTDGYTIWERRSGKAAQRR